MMVLQSLHLVGLADSAIMVVEKAKVSDSGRQAFRCPGESRTRVRE